MLLSGHTCVCRNCGIALGNSKSMLWARQWLRLYATNVGTVYLKTPLRMTPGWSKGNNSRKAWSRGTADTILNKAERGWPCHTRILLRIENQSLPDAIH